MSNLDVEPSRYVACVPNFEVVDCLQLRHVGTTVVVNHVVVRW